VDFKGFTKQIGRLIKFETDFTLYLFTRHFVSDVPPFGLKPWHQLNLLLLIAAMFSEIFPKEQVTLVNGDGTYIAPDYVLVHETDAEAHGAKIIEVKSSPVGHSRKIRLIFFMLKIIFAMLPMPMDSIALNQKERFYRKTVIWGLME